MKRHANRTRTGFTLIEAITAIVILAISVPVTVSMLSDAAGTRVDTINVSRATWYAHTVIEHIIADANSESPELGMNALDDELLYLTTPATGLNPRLAPLVQVYTDAGFTHTVDLGPPVAVDGTSMGIEELDVYRYVTVTISWTSPRTGTETLTIGTLISDLNN